MSLRRRLVVLVVGVVAVGLFASGAAGTLLLRSFALQRVDRQLAGFARRPGFDPAASRQFALRCDRLPVNPTGIVIEFYDPTGVLECAPASDIDPGGGPALTAAQLARTDDRPFTVAGKRGGHQYRVVVRQLSAGGSVVRAIDLAEANSTWRDQAVAAAVTGAVVLALVGLGGLLLVRRHLRPLEEIAATADAIAAGNRSSRVSVDHRASEVDRLATAFNAMLTSIEGSFTAQQHSEDKLRRFVADASHELRTPLTSIRGWAELYRDGALGSTERVAGAMGHIEHEADRMCRLVDDLLLLAAFDEGQVAASEPVDLVEVVHVAADGFAAAAPDRPLTLELPARLVVPGDRPRLDELVGNLLANARTHTPPGSPVEVALRVHGPAAVLEVVDHGPGVPPERREAVFERFTRLDPSRVRQGASGSGLGLAIVQAVAHAHGASVEITDTAGGGATFVVSLPLPNGEREDQTSSVGALGTTSTGMGER